MRLNLRIGKSCNGAQSKSPPRVRLDFNDLKEMTLKEESRNKATKALNESAL